MQPPAGQDSGTSEAQAETGNRHAPNGCRDRLLLVGAALLVCVTGVGAFLLCDIYHVSPAWVFVVGNSIVMVPLFIKDFRAQLKKPSFIVYLIAWAVIHGLFVATLMRWFSIAAMIPFLAIELTLGYIVADYFFDIRPAKGGP